MAAPRDDTRDRIGDLPERHLAALRAVLAGFGDQDLAGLLGIPVEAVPATIRLAAAKLLTAVSERPSGAVGAGGRRRSPSTGAQDQHPPADDPGAHPRSHDEDSNAPSEVPDKEHP